MPTLSQMTAAPVRGLFARATAALLDPRRGWEAVGRRAARLVPPPAVFHITHYKAGSQWVLRILNTLAAGRVVPPGVDPAEFLARPVAPGMVYPTLYVTREEFEAARLPRRWRRFVVVRDLRDTLVSAYFSLKHSHGEVGEHITRFRARLNALPLEQGLIRVAAEWLPPVAAMQRSWAAAGEPLVRYADLLTDDVAIFQRVLVDQCRLRVSRDQVREVVLANRFEARTRDRKRGDEDVTSHERKGVAGDWRNYFTPRLAKRFKDWYGDVLVAVGDERDANW
ncbi:sulfotransferase domain-containing protein [Gemmata sp.]|uniref:sulfotransferase domain-containing protein n=1 Tax=Gemmata sp. TaxID=1914242 RepID=UPI003F713F0C